MLAVLALVVIFGLVMSQLSMHLGLGIALLLVAVLVASVAARRKQLHGLTRSLALGLAGLATAILVGSVVLLVAQLVDLSWAQPAGHVPSASALLGYAGLIWLSNVLVFALWYFEIDAGGPAVRHLDLYESPDLLFPQRQRDDEHQEWSPQFVDYLFLTFNSSTALSPTDTMILSRRMKLLMMCQALVSLSVLAVVASRAVNALAGPT
jgi:uncharacterized membrane protein